MAKKFVRKITDVKNISKLDLNTNDVNDIISDGTHCYIRTPNKKYFCLTDKITFKSGSSINIDSNGYIRQLYTKSASYTDTSKGSLTTYSKVLSSTENINSVHNQYFFNLCIKQGNQTVTFTLKDNDKNNFNAIITRYGVENSVRINGCLFTLSDATLTVTTEADTSSNLVISYVDIIQSVITANEGDQIQE